MPEDTHATPGGTQAQTGATPTANGRFATGQTKYSETFSRLCSDRFRHVYGIGWHYWDGRRWTPCLEEEHREELKQLLIKLISLAAEKQDQTEVRAISSMMSASAQAGILSISQHSPVFARAAQRMDSDPWSLNTGTGVVDLMTGDVRPATPDDDITKVTAAGFNPSADSTNWTAFLDQILPNEAIQKYLQQYTGLSLLGVVREHIFAIATGTGANGKSTFVEAVSHALGDYAHTAEQHLLMSSHRGGGAAIPELVALRGTRWVVTSETDEGAKLNSALTKRITGGDTITARGLYENPISFAPSWTILMVTNHLPLVKASDDAVWRRVRVIPFDVVIPKEDRDPTLGDKLKLEADAILAWAIAGLQQYIRNGFKLDTPTEVTGATAAYRNDSDDIAKFISQRTELDATASASSSDLWSAWQAWAKNESIQPGKQSEFNTALELRGCTKAVVRVAGKQVRSFKGIRLLDDDATVAVEESVITETAETDKE